MPLFTASLDIRLVRVEDAFLTGYCARRVGGVRKVSVCVVSFLILTYILIRFIMTSSAAESW